jgi:hypothetical protein
VAPDVQQLAQMKLKNLLPTSKNPGQLTSGIIGQILGNKNQGQNGAQQPQGGLSGILGAIGGKQKQQQPNSGVSANEGQKPQAQPTATPNPLGGILGKVLGGNRNASPTPTPER